MSVQLLSSMPLTSQITSASAAKLQLSAACLVARVPARGISLKSSQSLPNLLQKAKI